MVKKNIVKANTPAIPLKKSHFLLNPKKGMFLRFMIQQLMAKETIDLLNTN